MDGDQVIARLHIPRTDCQGVEEGGEGGDQLAPQYTSHDPQGYQGVGSHQL